MADVDWKALAAPFPLGKVKWRPHALSRDGTKALALAYIDAREVMNRLDQVVGPGNWKDDLRVAGPRVICWIFIRVDGEWIGKSDGAGDSDVEPEKGGLSDAFKRAAVKWGVGRYLYALGSPWVPCAVRKGQDGRPLTDHSGKMIFHKFTDDPWKHVKRKPDEAVKREPIQEGAPVEGYDPDTGEVHEGVVHEGESSGKGRPEFTGDQGAGEALDPEKERAELRERVKTKVVPRLSRIDAEYEEVGAEESLNRLDKVRRRAAPMMARLAVLDKGWHDELERRFDAFEQKYSSARADRAAAPEVGEPEMAPTFPRRSTS